MKNVIIIGGGIAGLTAGILLQKHGFQTEIYEKNAVPGGHCTGWKREGFFIDNCIHWLTGTKEGSGLHALWKEIGALKEGVELYEKEMFFSSESDGQTVTFWRDLERTKKELLALSPQDEKEIVKLLHYVKLAEHMSVPVEKPLDMMKPWEFMKLGMSMKDMGKVMKEYGKMDIQQLAQRFHHPLIQRAILDYMPPGYQAYTFLVSYATITSGNGDIPRGGSLAMALRIADTYKKSGGILHMNAEVTNIMLKGHHAEGIQLADGTEVRADYIICACDTSYTFQKLLPPEYMPKQLAKQYTEREKYPVNSAFQIAFAVDGTYEDLTGTKIFSCEELCVGAHSVHAMSIHSYDYEPSFAPEGKMVIQSNFALREDDYAYWEKLYEDPQEYRRKKQALAEQAMMRLIAKYPYLEGNVRILDVWTPMTYVRYCHSYKGAYMSFVTSKDAKSITTPGVVKGIDNVLLANQWLMGPGGLPAAAAMGKFAAYRLIKRLA